MIYDGFEVEVLSPPENETPREMLLRLTGYDFTALEDVTWEYVREYPPMGAFITRLIERCYKPSIILRKL